MQWYSASARARALQIGLDVLAVVVLIAGVLLGRGMHDAIAALRAVGADVATSGAGFSRTMTDIGRQLGGIPLLGTGIRAPFDAAGAAGSTLTDAGTNWQVGVERVASTAQWTVTVLVVLFLLVAWFRPRLAGAILRGRLARLAATDGAEDLLALRALLARPREALAVSHDAVAAWRAGDPDITRRLAALELRSAGVRSPAS
jgi:chloramphenicol 3-O-phosphotransferase